MSASFFSKTKEAFGMIKDSYNETSVFNKGGDKASPPVNTQTEIPSVPQFKQRNPVSTNMTKENTVKSATQSRFNFKKSAPIVDGVPSFMAVAPVTNSSVKPAEQVKQRVLNIPDKEQKLRIYCKDVLGFYDAEDTSIPIDYILSDDLFGGTGVKRYMSRGFDKLDATLLAVGIAKEEQAI